MFDYHMHSRVSFDGHDTGRAMAEAALSAGLKEICFTDHLDYDPLGQMGKMDFDTELYNAEYDGAYNNAIALLDGYDTEDYASLRSLADTLEALNSGLFGAAAADMRSAANSLESYEAYK